MSIFKRRRPVVTVVRNCNWCDKPGLQVGTSMHAECRKALDERLNAMANHEVIRG